MEPSKAGAATRDFPRASGQLGVRGVFGPPPGKGCQELAGENAPAAYLTDQESFGDKITRGASRSGGAGAEADRIGGWPPKPSYSPRNVGC